MGGLFKLIGGAFSSLAWLPYAAIAALIGVCTFLYLRLDATSAHLEAERARTADLQHANTANTATIVRLASDRDRADAAISAEIKRRRTVEIRFSRLKERIGDAPPDGCVGPAVRAVIDGLHRTATDH